MGSLYRSIEMVRCQLFVQTEVAYHTVAELGELGLTMFKDLNPSVNTFQRNFVNEVRRCDEMERQLRFIEKELRHDHVEITETAEVPDCPLPTEMNALETTFSRLESEVKEMNVSSQTLQKNYSDLLEMKSILERSDYFFPTAAQIHLQMREEGYEILNDANNYDHVNIQVDDKGEKPELNYVCGVVPTNKVMVFEQLLWRTTRGNIFIRLAEIPEPIFDPKKREYVHKTIFIVFFQGAYLKSRVKKIVEGFHATSYDIPINSEQRREMFEGVSARMADLNIVIAQTTDHRRRALLAAARNIRIWFAKVWKMKGVYHTLNLFSLDVTQKCFIAECWLPRDDFEKVHMALKRGLDNASGSVPSILHQLETTQSPPTYYRTNKFTNGFQNLVSSYGVANYREINPAPYTIITFPFLFGVMFGDLGHGFIMFLFALFLVLREKKLEAAKIRDDIFEIFFGGRYIILLMGMFSMYTGIIYNELFSKAMNIFGSEWSIYFTKETIQANSDLQLDPKFNYSYLGVPYPFGIDPVWSMAENSLTFLNTFKMKMSVIIGISQMLFGVFLSLLNYRYFKSALDIFAVFIPQLLFMCCIFVYLCVLIIYKWVVFGSTPINFTSTLHQAIEYDPNDNTTVLCDPNIYESTFCAPSLLIGLINMFMFSEPKIIGFCGSNCSLQPYYPYQAMIEHVLVIIAFICIPWMLLVKPFVIRSRHRKQLAYESAKNASRMEMQVQGSNGTTHNGAVASSSKGGHGDDEEEFDFSEVFIHQAIHTIEYCLGCISHTASYLRLWALSLAHSELSNVLWHACGKVIPISFSMDGIEGKIVGGVIMFLVFWIFSSITIAVLLVMEGLSAFLHSLRLHWVEFQTKFYTGDGYAFEPFNFAVIVKESEDALFLTNQY